jgi:hypothetical protein
MQMESKFDSTISQFLFPVACLYIGATRSLKNYDLKQKRKTAKVNI